jgi:hypothetical protein
MLLFARKKILCLPVLTSGKIIMRSLSNCRIAKFADAFLFSVCVAIVSQLFVVLPARADCDYEGTTYQTGEKVGPYVCMPDGKWQQQ